MSAISSALSAQAVLASVGSVPLVPVLPAAMSIARVTHALAVFHATPEYQVLAEKLERHEITLETFQAEQIRLMNER